VSSVGLEEGAVCVCYWSEPLEDDVAYIGLIRVKLVVGIRSKEYRC
jgi:hypothetical protein